MASVGYDARPPGKTSNRSRFAWGFVGWEWCVSLGRYVKKASHFDKRGNRRVERVEDPDTGQVMTNVDHRLREDHQGHGSAKFTDPS